MCAVVEFLFLARRLERWRCCGLGIARKGFRAYMYYIKAMESVSSRIECCHLDLIVTVILH